MIFFEPVAIINRRTVTSLRFLIIAKPCYGWLETNMVKNLLRSPALTKFVTITTNISEFHKVIFVFIVLLKFLKIHLIKTF